MAGVEKFIVLVARKMRDKLTKLVAWCAYYLGVDALFYWLNRRAKRILTFHNVLPEGLLPAGERSCICFSDKVFATIVDEAARHFSFSTDLLEEETCSITFDDGYLNQLEIAGAILRQKGIPAILFLASDLTNAASYRQALAVDLIHFWVVSVPMEVAETHWQRTYASREELWIETVRPLFAADAANRGRAVLKQLDAIYPLESAFRQYDERFLKLRYAGISAEMIKEFRRAGWRFGHHTYSHFPLRQLPEAMARQEICPPAGMREVPFSYPYGDAQSISPRDVEIVRKSGYPCAVSNFPYASEMLSRHYLPRIMLATDDKVMIHFSLSGLKYFLKERALLPRLKELS